MELKLVPIEDLKPLEGNPRIITEDGLNRIKVSIEGFGFIEPIIAWKNEKGELEIVVGHQRRKAAKKTGRKKLPTIIFPFKNRKAAIAYNIASNRTNELAGWDFPKLKDGLEYLDDGEFKRDLTGFSDVEVEALMGHYKEPPFSNIIKDSVKEITIKMYFSDVGYELYCEAIDVALFGEGIGLYDRAMRTVFEMIDSRKRGEALAKICKDWLRKCAGVV